MLQAIDTLVGLDASCEDNPFNVDANYDEYAMELREVARDILLQPSIAKRAPRRNGSTAKLDTFARQSSKHAPTAAHHEGQRGFSAVV